MKIDYLRLSFINYLYLIILELVFKIFVMDVVDEGIFYILLFSLPVSFLITFIESLFKKKIVNQIISIIIWGLILFVFCGETVYFSFYKTICGLSALEYGGQVMEFYSAILVHVKANLLLLIIYFIPFISLIVLSVKKVIKYEQFKLNTFMLLLVPSICLSVTALEYNHNDSSSAYNLFYETNDLMESTNRFGVMSSVSLDAVKYLSGFEESINVTVNRTFTQDEETEYNITDIDFDYLIENESDETVKNMHIYFSNQSATNKNEYTGIFAGKNLIFITAEGFYPIAVNEELTPTLYKLTNSSFVFTNYYQPIFNCSTSDGEFINTLSILPGVSTCSMTSTSNNYLPYSLGNIMQNYGYNTYAFHGWDYSYYDRDETMPNLGYTYYGYDRYHKGYEYALQGIKDSWPTSDIDVVNASYPIYGSDEHYITYYMSISGHLEYNFGGNAMAQKNKALVSDLDASDAIKAYIATQIEFDRSLEILINDLESEGKLDDTVIVIAADHYPYGLSNEEISEYVDWMQNDNFDLYKNNLIIYNPSVEKTVVDKHTSSLDILPTLLNMFGVEYDSRLLMGTDIFSDSEDLVIFNNKSWITSKGRYDYLKKTFEPFNGENVDQSYIDNINEIVKLKFQMSKLLISKDYYRKVFGE